MTRFFSSRKVRFFKIAVYFIGFILFSLAYARGIMAVERAIKFKALSAYDDLVNQIAMTNGYIQPPPQAPQLSIREIAEREALRAQINPKLIHALIKHESNNEEFAISHKSALGLMQVMPFNAARCGLKPAQLLIPEENIRCGVKIFREDLQATNHHVPNALRRYNGGPKCVTSTCKESENHMKKVLEILAKDITL